MKETIEKRLAQLKIELEQLVAEANHRISMKEGAIVELERLLIEVEQESTE